ncbi:unnamed protein product [Mytilus edulis]|uniref:Uncharacterized protein n=1 Tax=Mytilus edulis TaxID=6550 RepID=A0A8S3TXI9_MYTED|nr:unnamed protein product [Mytilus edulis]
MQPYLTYASSPWAYSQRLVMFRIKTTSIIVQRVTRPRKIARRLKSDIKDLISIVYELLNDERSNRSSSSAVHQEYNNALSMPPQSINVRSSNPPSALVTLVRMSIVLNGKSIPTQLTEGTLQSLLQVFMNTLVLNSFMFITVIYWSRTHQFFVCGFVTQNKMRRHVLKTYLTRYCEQHTNCLGCEVQKAQTSSLAQRHVIEHGVERTVFDEDHMHLWCQLMLGSLLQIKTWFECSNLDDLLDYIFDRKLNTFVLLPQELPFANTVQ